MKKAKLLLGVFFCCCTVTVSAQNTDSLKKIYHTDLMYRFGLRFMVGEEKIRNRAALKPHFAMSPDGMGLYKKSLRQFTCGRLLGWGSAALSIATINSVIEEKRSANYFITAQLVMAIVANYLINTSQKMLDRAIWHRNRDLLFKPKF
jgi:hypothetical protein